MWQGKKSFVLHAHTHVDIRCMDMCICVYICMYGCTTIWSESQRRKLFDGHWWWYVRCCAPSEQREGGWGLGLCVRVQMKQGMGSRDGREVGVQLAHFCWPAKLLTSCLASNVDNPMEHLVGSVRFKCFMNLFQWSQTRCVRVRAYHTYTNIQTCHTYRHTYICAFALAGDMWQQKPCLRLTWPAVVVWLRSVRPSDCPPALSVRLCLGHWSF